LFAVATTRVAIKRSSENNLLVADLAMQRAEPFMKKIQIPLILTIALFFLCQTVSAALIRNSQIVGFNTGNLGNDSATGTLDGWQNSTPQVTVTNGSGSLDGTGLGLVISAGDKVFLSATNTLSARNQFVTNTVFPQTVETNIYYSFLYRFNDASQVTPGYLMIRVNRANSGTGTAQHWDLVATNVAGQIQVGIAKAGAPNNVTNFATTNISSGQTFVVVVRQHIIPAAQNDIYDLWINPPREFFGTNDANIPPSSASVGALTTDGTEDSSTTGPGRFVIGSGASANFDEFRVATTWAEAVPPLGQCNGAAVASDPVSVTQSAEISANFGVSAGGTSPTIQWQLSTDSGATWNNIANATASSYTTPNLPLSSSGNQYRAIVSVACNSSSATSAVAVVTLTAPVVSPVGLVMDDFFDDQLRDNTPVTVSNSVWRTANSANLDAISGDMVGTPLPGSSSLWLGYFTDDTETNLPIHLDIGRALRITLPFTANSFNSFTNNAGLRIGAFDYADSGSRLTSDSPAAGGSTGNGINVRGYMLNLDFGTNFTANSPLQLLARNFLNDNNLMGTVADYVSLGSGPAGGGYSNAPSFHAGTQYTLVFTVARTAVNSVDITAAISGGGTNWTWSVTETNYAYHRFDAFGIRANSLETSADSFTFPEFRVELVQSAIVVPPFNITSIRSLAPDSIALTWTSVSGVNYQIQSRDSLSAGSWITNATILANSTSTFYTNSPIPASVIQRYYRVVATP
jgi:hypothetical protein